MIGLRRLGSGARRTSTFVVVVVQTAFVGWTALRMADSSTFLAHVIPTRASVGAFADAVDAAFVAMNDYAAPIPDDRNVVILTAATIGLVAVIVDAIVVGRRQAAWAGLPLLAVYAIPATVLPAGLGVLAFLGPAVGYLLLLATEGSLRIRGWGAPVGLGFVTRPSSRSGGHADASSGTSAAAVTDAGLPVAAELGTDDEPRRRPPRATRTPTTRCACRCWDRPADGSASPRWRWRSPCPPFCRTSTRGCRPRAGTGPAVRGASSLSGTRSSI